MKWLSKLPPALVTLIALSSVALAEGGKIEVQGAGADQNLHKVVVFRNAEGTETQRLTLEGGEVTKDGKKKRRTVDALASEDRTRVVTVEEERDADEHNPHITRFASATSVSLYDARGTKLCTTQTRAIPRLISKTGRAFVAIDQGLDPESFEVPENVPGKSVEDLKEDSSLTESYLQVLDDSCNVDYSTTSTKGGWKKELLSPSGRWLLLEENESGVFSKETGWKYFLAVVDIRTGKAWPLWVDSHRDIDPRSISDDGTVLGRKHVGESSALSAREVKATDGRMHRFHKNRIQYLEWKPGMTSFQSSGPEVDEEK